METVRRRLREDMWVPGGRRRWVPCPPVVCPFCLPPHASSLAREAVAAGLGSPRPRPAWFCCLPSSGADASLSTASSSGTSACPPGASLSLQMLGGGGWAHPRRAGGGEPGTWSWAWWAEEWSPEVSTS